MTIPNDQISAKILVVEDDIKTAAAIELYLQHGGYRVLHAQSGVEAIEMARTHTPTLIILDIMLPHLDGLDVCRLLRADSTVPIIMLTARTLEEDQLQGFALGADDYITKPFSPRMLLARVRAVLWRTRSQVVSAGDIIEQHGISLDRTRHEVRVQGQLISLTMKEFKLLEILMQRPGRVFTRETLVTQVFGHDYDGLDRSVDTLAMRLRRKIEPDPKQPQYVLTVYGIGYKFAEAVE